MRAQGLVLLDKPEGLSSNTAVQKVRRLLGIKKAGHTGTLDPFASGMLPVLLGPCTKLATYYLAENKTYFAQMALGAQTDTGDREGQIIAEQAIPDLTQDHITAACKLLTGQRLQTPPLYSALKFQGKPLYQWAREGVSIPREPRQIHIHEIQLLHFDSTVIDIQVSCSKGTYIRTLVEEIAEQLGTVAYCKALRRLSVGQFKPEQMLTLDQIELALANGDDSFLASGEEGLQGFPSFEMSDEVLMTVRQGRALAESIQVPEGLCRLKFAGQLLGMGQIDARRIITGRWL